MKKKLLISFMLLPLILSACGGGTPSTSSEPATSVPGTSETTSTDPQTSEEGTSIDSETSRTSEEYERWINGWSESGHLYMHYLRPSAQTLEDYDDWGIWIWPNSPKNLEGSMWGAVNDAFLATVPHPMTRTRMTNIGGSGKDYDEYGVIYDIDLDREDIVGGKTGKPVSFLNATKVGFLVAKLSSMDGSTHWTSDGGADLFISDFKNHWRDNGAMHVFLVQGDCANFAFNSGTEVEINPTIDDKTGQYRSVESRINDKYAGQIPPTSSTFKSKGVGYQVFVASFRDSNNDGVGDLQGVIDSLDYLQNDLNVSALWLTPVMVCGSYHGYDTVDYYHIDDKFGTDRIFSKLVEECHKRNIVVLMDLVLNHTSKNNVWYRKSQKAAVGKDEATGADVTWRNIYHWKYKNDKVLYYNRNTKSYQKINVQDHPDWYKDGESDYYYYGKFGSGMPELNYDNQETRNLVINLAKYWLAKGVDGYRLDAVKHIYMKDEVDEVGNDIIVSDIGSKNYYDEELKERVTTYFDYSSDVTRNVEFWKEFSMGIKQEYPNAFLVGENFDGYGARIAPYYQAIDSQFDFSNFYHTYQYAYQNQDATARTYGTAQYNDSYTFYKSSADNSDLWNDQGQKIFNGNYPTGHRSDFINGAFTSNHDTERAINHINQNSTKEVTYGGNTIRVTNVTGTAGQIGKAKVAAALTILSPGLSWIYYGDELGMTSNTYEHYGLYGNENNVDIWYRQPFKWGDASYTTAYESGSYIIEWDSYNKNTLKSMEEQQTINSSMLNYYKNLTAIKARFGASINYDGQTSNTDGVVYYKVTGTGGTWHIYINTTSQQKSNISMANGTEYWCNNDGSTTGSKGTLKGYSCVAIKAQEIRSMKRLFPKLGLAFASLALVITSGIFAGSVARGDDFVDPIQYADAPARNALLIKDEEEADVPEVHKVIIHYHNDDGKNESRRFWLWVTDVDGAEYEADQISSDKKDMSITLDYAGAFSDFAGQGGIYLIIKNAGTWDGQSEDTFISFTLYPPVDYVVEFWLIPGIGNALEICATEEETRSDRVTEAYFSSFKNILVKATAAPKVYRLYSYDQKYLNMSVKAQANNKETRLLKTGSASTATFDIPLTYNAHINVQYVLETEYEAWPGRMHSLVISFSKLYENPRFSQYYEYSGDDLGVTYTKESTTFKLWAPTAGNVSLKIYDKGTTKGDDPEKGGYGSSLSTTYKMNYLPHGVWGATLDGDLNGKYYTYVVYNSSGINEVVDPYAHACGANGKRGMVLDFDSTDPEGWEAIDGKWDKKAGYDITSPQQLSIYESHIRDLTMDDSWGGTEKPGTYLAYIEKGTTYTQGDKTVKTGFDHIEELGVNAIQFTPVYDHDNIEYFKRPIIDSEGKTTYEVSEGSYNWGYNPLNYNCVEGQYSSNPNDGAARVREFKQMILALATNANKARTIMDVVYNHVSSGSNSNFTKIMPQYFFRYTQNGEYYNGSGCGNEVKTEAPMMRKFIIDSLCWWASEYNVKGFRFDLMGLIDYVTLKEAAKALYKIDPDIYLYGEGWTGDGSDAHIDQTKYNTWGANTYVTYRDLRQASGQCAIGCFNDYGRDNFRGGNDRNYEQDPVAHRLPGYGFMSNGSDYVGGGSDEAGWMMIGKNNNGSVAEALSTSVAAKMTVNYASCHDNYALFDQFSATLGDGGYATAANIAKAETSTNMAIMLSNGVAFMQGGEELFRTKIVTEEDAEKIRMPEDYVEINGIKIAHNAYKCSDETNAFDYSRKISLTYKGTTENNIYENYFTQLATVIKLRKNLKFKTNIANSGSGNFWASGNGETKLGYYIDAVGGGYVMILGGRGGGQFGNASNELVAKVGASSADGSTMSVGNYSCGVYRAK